MSDRELLEMAAKAAGAKQDTDDAVCTAGLWISLDRKSIYEIFDPSGWRYWNPLADYGDRYRLARAVKGNLYFSGRRGCFEIPSDGDEPSIVQYFTVGNETEEAYAITRAAAEIGKAMEEKIK